MASLESLAEDYVPKSLELALQQAIYHDKAFLEAYRQCKTIRHFYGQSFYVDAASVAETEKLKSDLEECCVSNGMSEDDANIFIYGVMEAVQNAQKHGYHLEPGKKVLVSAQFSNFAYQVGVYSEGRFDGLDQVRGSIAQSMFERKNGKRGFAIMSKCSNMIFPNNLEEHTEIILTRVRPGPYE